MATHNFDGVQRIKTITIEAAAQATSSLVIPQAELAPQ